MNRLVARYGGGSNGGDDMAYSTIGPVARPKARHLLEPESSSAYINSNDDDARDLALHPTAASCSAFSLTSVPSMDAAAAFLKGTTLATVVERVATTLASATMATIEDECNYDVDPTGLYLAVQDGRWDDAVRRCRTHPLEASTWVYRTERADAGNNATGGPSLRWRLLPIHAACVFRAPAIVLRALLDAHPGGASLGDDQGKLPLHLCLRRSMRGDDDGPDEEVVSLLTEVYPGGVHVADDGGRTPRDLVLAIRCGATRARLMRCIGIDPVVVPSVVASSGERTVSRPDADSIRLPRQLVAGEARMDGELLARLKCRREALDRQHSMKNGSFDRPREGNNPSSSDAEGVEVEYDVDEIMMLEGKEEDKEDADVGVGVEVEYDVDNVIMRKEKEEEKGDDGADKVEIEYDVDEIMKREGKAAVDPPTAGSSPLLGGDYEGNGSMERHVVDDGWGVDSSSRAGRSIVDTAPPSLRDQIRVRVERRRKRIESSGNDKEIFVQRTDYSSRLDPPIHDPVDIDAGRHQLAQPQGGGWTTMDSLNYDEVVTIPSSICSSTTGGTGCMEDNGLIQQTAKPSMAKINLEKMMDKTSLAQRPRKSKIDLLPMSPPVSIIDLEVYNSTSLTVQTDAMTEAPSSSYEDCSLCETYTSSIKRAKQKGVSVFIIDKASNDKRKIDPIDVDISTPRLLMALEKFGSLSAIGSDIGENHDLDDMENAGSMKKELEAALKDKLKLKAQVKKLVRMSNEQSVQLEKERESNHIKMEKFNREMEISLARKAADLEKCTAVAVDQAEESKRRALELAQQDMEKEVSLLRSQLDVVQSIGVPVDRSLIQALGLVESNQRALRHAAERDAKSALRMKEEIEKSFIDAVSEFEAWSEKQLRLMEAKWERLNAYQ
ncbi:hypothetical protein ACHAXA_010792 [Cyclostephanos tholiformis]|uniref:Uncharacterized protein n=1 Tax=Cyclostephanos tholiformis TaxID=382380 RepID=A0ABD3RTW3_9STRA